MAAERPDPALVIETHSLTKRYGSQIVAVEDLNLQVLRGEVYGYIGPNGAGKTTTMKMLLGLIRPTSGSAWVVGHLPGDSRALRTLGSLVETPTFYPFLSGRDNLRVVARYAGISNREVDIALDMVKLTKRAGDRFATYSLGMKQRLGVAAALVKNPALLILDEPTNGLDPPGMMDMRQVIQRQKEEGRTVLLSSHQLSDVELLCDRVGVMHGGRMVAEGTVDELRGPADLHIRARPHDRARRAVERVVAPDRVLDEGDDLVVRAGGQERDAIAATLGSQGVVVVEMTLLQRTLEDVFFALTGGSTAGAGSLRSEE